ncbi:ABC transporter permease [Pseudolysinimonas yzui]|uniref:Transport permease protein n=1 Tax=Pseudolysinimonas yzui TaxID=2708254 RepID=A0A8J3GQH3_9MICO|nr:ABC transporter permease [Pseudolysinimonas yzui]GHF14938.1 transport permease protein [Pseudolysinimonas yzui]
MTSVIPPRAAVRADPAKSRRYGAWYVVEHKLRAVRAYFWTMLVTAFGTPFLYLFAFGVGLASLVVDSQGDEFVDGVGYLQFVAPALIVNAAVLVAAEEYMFGMLLGFKWNAIFIGMNSAPLTGRQIIDGMFLFVAIRAAFTAGIYFAAVALFGGVISPWSVLVVPIAMLTAFAFSPVAAWSATITEDRGQFNIVNRLIIMPLSLFSGTVFPLSQLPVFLQWIGWISPIWHGSELSRQFSYGPTEPIWLSVIHVLFLLALAIVGWRLTVHFSVKRLDR